MNNWLVFNRGVVFPWHCDHYGHMNVRWYSHFFDDGSFLSWSTIGLDMPALVSSGVHAVVASSNVQFKCETLAGTALTILGRFAQIGNTSVTVEQRMVESLSENLHAEHKYVLVFCNSESRQPVRIPNNFREKIIEAGANVRT